MRKNKGDDDDMKYLEGKSALITGGGRGIGKAVALEFAKNGANIAIAARTRSELENTTEEIENFGVEGKSIVVDLTNLDEIKKCVRKYFQYFKKCDVLVNNAGKTQYASIVDYPIEEAKKLFDLNILGSYAITKYILPNMVSNQAGSVIFTSSVQGNIYFGSKKVAYAASKAALSAMSKCLQIELSRHNIRVNAILPGPINTKMMDYLIEQGQHSGSPDQPDEIAPIYLFLASSLSERKYKGELINQQRLFQILTDINAALDPMHASMKEILNKMKEQFGKDSYRFLRKNKDLIEFMLNYKQ
ncbi:MAG: SDR family NAD(P)-dependent oxidoreductase [Candidatus Lokiarchaeota archaeon]|nr:SDR family NAD(P)-dependent oxidoreductase [Candidatus Lokiarchaeota archaeon]MBD3338848.1 SDR family NAD(P)-dependent oxidoreductase [Candidatus Lokiarchaeota archaeon]